VGGKQGGGRWNLCIVISVKEEKYSHVFFEKYKIKGEKRVFWLFSKIMISYEVAINTQ